MAKKYYLDSSIWRDYYENRSDKFRPLGEWALTLIKNIIENEGLILYSDMTTKELKGKYDENELKGIFEVVEKEKFLIKVDISDAQAGEAAKLCKDRDVAFGDELHAILARDNKAIMIARDKHFDRLQDIADIKKPEDLI